jgi:hypothetical protein
VSACYNSPIEVAVSKKWYNFFVVTGGPGTLPEAPETALDRRVGDLAVVSAPVVLAPEALVTGAGSVAEVYEAARIEAPAHGYTVLKVADMLQSDHIRALPPDVKRKSVLVALDAAGVPLDEIVQDAVRRDRALDTYEAVLEQHLEDVRAAKAAENVRIEEEIAARVAELRARVEANNLELSREQQELQTWRVRKQREEAVIAEAVSYFVSENPITAAPPPAAATGESDVR